MRLWHYKLLPYLPDLQFKGQNRELVAILHDWRDRGKTNHLLINRVMDYPKEEFVSYFYQYSNEYLKRYGKPISSVKNHEFAYFCFPATGDKNEELFEGWHDKEYLRVCMSNLYEKYKYGKGKSKITHTEWERVLAGYKQITGEEYII